MNAAIHTAYHDHNLDQSADVLHSSISPRDALLRDEQHKSQRALPTMEKEAGSKEEEKEKLVHYQSYRKVWLRQRYLDASVSSWTVCSGTCWRWMHQYIMSHRCSIRFRSGEREAQASESMPSSPLHMRLGIVLLREEPRAQFWHGGLCAPPTMCPPWPWSLTPSQTCHARWC